MAQRGRSGPRARLSGIGRTRIGRPRIGRGNRLAELLADERRRVRQGVRRVAGLEEYAAEHLKAKVGEGVTHLWLAQAEKHLGAAVSYFGSGRELTTIRPSHVRAFVEHLRTQPNGRGAKLTTASVRHYLNSLSNLFRRAVAEEVVVQNPVAALMTKPVPERREAEWLEVPDAARLLEAARTAKAKAGDGLLPLAYPLVGTLLLTGGRTAEVLGLEVEDVSFDRRTVTFRPNGHRRLKTRTSQRTVPLWPQLEEILRPYVFGRGEPLGDLLFPSPASDGRERMFGDVRKVLDAVGARAGFERGRIRTKLFRHTYCAARLQTLDRGAREPIHRESGAWALEHCHRGEGLLAPRTGQGPIRGRRVSV